MGFVDDRGRPAAVGAWAAGEDVSVREYRTLYPETAPDDPAYERTDREVQQASVQRAWGWAGAVVTVLFILAVIASAAASVRKGLSGGGWDIPCLLPAAVAFVVIAVLRRFTRFGAEDRAREDYFLAARAARIGRCPSCGYKVGGVPEEADGCRVCPECGGAWDLAAWARDWAVLEQPHESSDRNSRRWPTPANIRIVAAVGLRPLQGLADAGEVTRTVRRGACPCCGAAVRRAGHGRPWQVCDACRCVCWTRERLAT